WTVVQYGRQRPWSMVHRPEQSALRRTLQCPLQVARSPLLDRRALAQLLEPPYTDPYVRWCGRGGAERLPPIPISGTPRHFAAMQQLGRFPTAADISQVTGCRPECGWNCAARWRRVHNPDVHVNGRSFQKRNGDFLQDRSARQSTCGIEKAKWGERIFCMVRNISIRRSWRSSGNFRLRTLRCAESLGSAGGRVSESTVTIGLKIHKKLRLARRPPPRQLGLEFVET